MELLNINGVTCQNNKGKNIARYLVNYGDNTDENISNKWNYVNGKYELQ